MLHFLADVSLAKMHFSAHKTTIVVHLFALDFRHVAL